MEPRSTPAPASGFHAALSEAIAERGVSLEWLRMRLADRGTPVSLATLSYWRSGRSRPERLNSLEALAEIEDLLGLARGDLAARLGPSRRVGRPKSPDVSVADVVEHRAELIQVALDQLGLAGSDQLVESSVHVVVEVDGDGCMRAVSNRSIWRATVDGAQRAPLVFLSDDPMQAPPAIEVIAGGRLGQDYSRPEVGLVATEMVLDRPLRSGEETIVEQRTEMLEDGEDPLYEHYLVRRINELVLWVQFDAARVPGSAEVFVVTEGGETRQEVDLTGRTSAHHILRRFGPGRAGIRWAW